MRRDNGGSVCFIYIIVSCTFNGWSCQHDLSFSIWRKRADHVAVSPVDGSTRDVLITTPLNPKSTSITMLETNPLGFSVWERRSIRCTYIFHFWSSGYPVIPIFCTNYLASVFVFLMINQNSLLMFRVSELQLQMRKWGQRTTLINC